MKQTIDYRVMVHEEDGSYWAEVAELPGCFASGDSREELFEALAEAIGLYLSTPASPVRVQVENAEPVGEAVDARVLVC